MKRSVSFDTWSALLLLLLSLALASVAVASDEGSGAGAEFAPPGACATAPRNTLLARCRYCDAACVVYDQDARGSKLSGCDYNTSSPGSYCPENSGSCDVQCFEQSRDSTAFQFFVALETAVGTPVKRRRPAEGLPGPSSEDVPFQSNLFVKTIGVLDVNAGVTNLAIAGGNDGSVTKGVVAKVSVRSQVFSLAPQLKAISLSNMDLSGSIGNVLDSVPSRVSTLALRNVRLSSIPSGGSLTKLDRLETLILSDNSLSSIETRSVALPNLSFLDLSGNNLSRFAVETPKLTVLDLSDNNLAEIPASVFSFTMLKQLRLHNNPIQGPLVLSSSQLKFLQGLQLSIDVQDPPATITSQPGGNITSTTKTTTVEIGGSNVPVLIDNAQPTSESSQPSSADVDGADSSGSASLASSIGDDVGRVSDEDRVSGGVQRDVDAAPIAPSTRQDSTASENASTSQSQKSDGTSTLLVVVIIFGAAVVVALIVGLVWRKRRDESKQKLAARFDHEQQQPYVKMPSNIHSSTSSVTRSMASSDVPFWTDDELHSYRLRAAEIREDRVIGSGGSAVVWLVSFRRDSHRLASKRLLADNGRLDRQRLVALVSEIKLAASLSHPSVVQFFGVAWTTETNLQALFEYMPQGDLRAYLSRTEASSTQWLPDKLRLAVDVVEALVYTHSFDPPLLHRALKSRNVLLTDELKAKLGDFGSACGVSDNDTMTADGAGAGRWLAPEVLAGSTSYDTSSDIYSFGVLLAELDTHQVPYADVMDPEGNAMNEVELLQRVAQGELQPTLSDACPVNIRHVALSCLSFHASHRPTAIQVAFLLRQILEPSPKMILY